MSEAASSIRPGTFQYLVPEAEPSLFRNGKVLTRRDSDGSDGGREGVVLAPTEVAVEDARALGGTARRSVARHGFELLDAPLSSHSLDFFDHNAIVSSYYDECAQIVQQASGAAAVFAFDHNVRSATGKSDKVRIAGGQQVQGPARVVHGDYTLTSAPQRLRDLAQPPSKNDTLRSTLGANQSLLEPDMVDALLASNGRFAIINVWRNILAEPVQTHPLALCDAMTVSPQDLVVFEIHYHDRIGENYFAKYNAEHAWYFYPEMTRDEVLLIKQWDCAGAFARSNGVNADDSQTGGPCTFSFHSAVEDATAPIDAPSRWSIEVRCVVIYA
jgi:hypothetical protein